MTDEFGSMSGLIKIFGIFILFVTYCAAAMGADPLIRVDGFAKLQKGDTLSVRYHTSGCFHDATYQFTFRRVSELTVSIVQLQRDVARAGAIVTLTNQVDLGSLTLSKSDVAGLDRLMQFYRSQHDGLCTTVNHISFTQQRDGKTMAIEEITDGSCQTYDKKSLTKFPELIARLSPQH